MSNKFNYVKKGYDPIEVDSYIETMEAVIKSYKEKDQAIKNAILNAQIAADGIILNAKNQAREVRETAIRQVMDIKNSIALQREMVGSFQDEYNAFLNRYLRSIENNDIKAVKSKIDALENFLNRFTSNDSVVNDAEPEKKNNPKQEMNKISSQEHKELLK